VGQYAADGMRHTADVAAAGTDAVVEWKRGISRDNFMKEAFNKIPGKHYIIEYTIGYIINNNKELDRLKLLKLIKPILHRANKIYHLFKYKLKNITGPDQYIGILEELYDNDFLYKRSFKLPYSGRDKINLDEKIKDLVTGLTSLGSSNNSLIELKKAVMTAEKAEHNATQPPEVTKAQAEVTKTRDEVEVFKYKCKLRHLISEASIKEGIKGSIEFADYTKNKRLIVLEKAKRLANIYKLNTQLEPNAMMKEQIIVVGLAVAHGYQEAGCDIYYSIRQSYKVVLVDVKSILGQSVDRDILYNALNDLVCELLLEMFYPRLKDVFDKFAGNSDESNRDYFVEMYKEIIKKAEEMMTWGLNQQNKGLVHTQQIKSKLNELKESITWVIDGQSEKWKSLEKYIEES